MSFNSNWDVYKYREEHESDEEWELRRAFMIRWRDQYSEERLLCLARVFTNMELLGCRYPTEVMEEVARLSEDIVQEYRDKRKNKLQRTFVSASDAAEDYVKRTKRKNNDADTSRKKIAFVPQYNEKNDISHENGDVSFEDSSESKENIPDEKSEIKEIPHSIQSDEKMFDNVDNSVDSDENKIFDNVKNNSEESDENKVFDNVKNNLEESDENKTMENLKSNLKLFYTNQMAQVKCLDNRLFNEKMFQTKYGQFVLVIRPWIDMASNVINSCLACKLLVANSYIGSEFTLTVNGKVLACAEGPTKQLAKEAAMKIAWDYLRHNAVTLMVKEQWIPQNDTRISMSDMSGKHEFGKPIEDSVALKMMKLMGWKGGGLGVDSQGIAEPIKPNFQMVSRAGLGHEGGGMSALRRAGFALMKRRGDALDADLVFSAEFTAEERAVLHRCAQQCGLYSKSYGGKGPDRFLVVTNKVQPFTLVRAVTQQGGNTPKYQVFIPEALANIR